MSAARAGGGLPEVIGEPEETPVPRLRTARSSRRKRTPKALGPAIAIVVVLAVAALLIWQAVKPSGSAAKYVTSTVSRGTLTVASSGNGTVVVAKASSVAPQVSGTVANLSVALGGKVSAGQTLFTIVNDQLDGQVSQALSQYRQAQSSVDKAEQGVTQSDQQVEQAQGQVTQAKGQLQQARLKRSMDYQAYTKVRADPRSTSDQWSNAYDQVKIDDTNIAAAQNSVDAAKDGLDAAEQGQTAAESNLTAAKASKRASYLSYQQAVKTAGERTVKAPISGVITSLNVQNGDSIGGGGSSSSSSSSARSAASAASASSASGSSSAAMVISDLGTMQTQVSVSEVDRANIKVGQKTTLTFDAVPNLTLTGKVTSIDAVGTSSSGVVTYNVTIAFDSTDGRLSPGMTVTAAITTDVRTDVLYVPRSAVHSSSNGSYVLLMAQGATTPQQVAVETGASTDSDTEITSGLKEGDTIVTQSITSGSTSSGSSNRGGFGMFGGGGGGGGGVRVRGGG